MRVLLDTTYALRAPYSGTAVYLEQLSAALATFPEVELISCANHLRRRPAGGGLGSVRNLTSDLGWTSWGLAQRARQHAAQVIHHPLPAYGPAAPAAQVISVLDLAFERLPQMFDRGYRRFAHLSHRFAARRAAAVVCISQTTAEDVRELWGVPAEKVIVARLGPGQGLPSAPPVEHPSHFLYVGDAEPRKNLETLLEAYSRYRESAVEPLELVLAGSGFDSSRRPGIRRRLRPSSEELAGLLAGAAALVHPSLYEGFGLTPLEAMSAGTPVIAARSPGIVEVCEDAALLCDPRRPEEFADAMASVAADSALREGLRRRGTDRAGRFSWRDCALRHLEAYSLALGK